MKKRDAFYLCYFVVHIPITVLIDSCLVVPSEYRHWVQEAMVNLHIRLNKDFLLQDPPLWLQVFGLFELLFQLPLFFVAAYKLYYSHRRVHVLTALYGFNASFTTLVCLAYVLSTSRDHGLTDAEKWNLFFLYLPYLVIPAFMMVDSSYRLSLWIRRLHKLEARRRLEKSRAGRDRDWKKEKIAWVGGRKIERREGSR